METTVRFSTGWLNRAMAVRRCTFASRLLIASFLCCVTLYLVFYTYLKSVHIGTLKRDLAVDELAVNSPQFGGQKRSLVSFDSTANTTTKDLYNTRRALVDAQTQLSMASHGHTGTEDTSLNLTEHVPSNNTRPLVCRSCFQADFPVLIDSASVCKTRNDSERIDVILLVLTSHKSAERRQAIRNTWASVTRNNTANVRHAFLLGRSAIEEDMALVEKEQALYGDMVVHDFVDSYRNLTLKTISAFRWAVRHCGNARFFLKIDDDMWVNVPALLDTVNREEAALQTAVGGDCAFQFQPHRDPRSKWHAPFQSYPESFYPGFCSGTGYVSSLAMARHVISVSPDVPFFHLEDVYVGLCVQKLGPGFSVKKFTQFASYALPLSCRLKTRGVVTTHDMTPAKLRQLWKLECS